VISISMLGILMEYLEWTIWKAFGRLQVISIVKLVAMSLLAILMESLEKKILPVIEQLHTILMENLSWILQANQQL
jgi:hypothetical protein